MLRDRDSNPGFQGQNLACYRYTIPQQSEPSRDRTCDHFLKRELLYR